MRLIDLSQPVYHNAPNCPVHPPVKSELIATHEKDGWQCELLTLSNHTGSHVDAPLHKISGGVLQAALPKLPADAIVLLCTGWGEIRAKTEEWLHHSPFVDPTGAKWL